MSHRDRGGALEGSQEEKGPLGQGEGCLEVFWEMKEVQETWKIANMESPQASFS